VPEARRRLGELACLSKDLLLLARPPSCELASGQLLARPLSDDPSPWAAP